MIRAFRFASCLLLVFLAGCSSLAPFLATQTSVTVVDATVTPQPVSTPTSAPAETPRVLRVWLPPQFDPTLETDSGGLLNQRLKIFQQEHPSLTIEFRVKGRDVDILDILSTTNDAAPSAMPDLIALSYHEMQSAASAGYLHPLDGLTDIMQDPDWYAFSRELGSVQNTEYGIPFAADAMMIVYRPSVFELPPSNWDSVFDSGARIAYSVSDTQPYFPLALYLSASGHFTDDQGVITLDEAVLARVFSFYQLAHEMERFSFNIKDIQTDLQSLNSYRNGDADLAVVWASSDIGINTGRYATLLGLDNTPYSNGDGWVWALAGSNMENQPLAVELASFLVESDFMAEWTFASAYLPTRPLALAEWEDVELKNAMDDILLTAHPIPPDDVVTVLGPLMQENVMRVLNGEQADVVARSVVENLK